MRLILPAIVDLVFANDNPQGVACRIDSCTKRLVSGGAVCVMPVAGVRRAGDSVGARGRGRIDRIRDEVLLKRVASGDERALSDRYDHYASLVYGTGMRLPGDTEDEPSDALSRRFDVATALSRGIDLFRTGPSGRREPWPSGVAALALPGSARGIDARWVTGNRPLAPNQDYGHHGNVESRQVSPARTETAARFPSLGDG